jgi:hypothetical protein
VVATTRISMADISRQKRLEVDLGGRLTPAHTVGQAIDFYLEELGIPHADLRWGAFSRGVKLDNKSELTGVPDNQENDWTVMPEVSAGHR